MTALDAVAEVERSLARTYGTTRDMDLATRVRIERELGRYSGPFADAVDPADEPAECMCCGQPVPAYDEGRWVPYCSDECREEDSHE